MVYYVVLGFSDPYCKFKLGRQKYKTKVCPTTVFKQYVCPTTRHIVWPLFVVIDVVLTCSVYFEHTVCFYSLANRSTILSLIVYNSLLVINTVSMYNVNGVEANTISLLLLGSTQNT